MGDEAHFSPAHHVRHDATCDGCRERIFGVRHQCQICPDWNYCNNCIAQAPRKHAIHEFAAISDPKQARDTTAIRSQALDFGRLETRFLTIGPSPPSSNPPTEEAIKVSCELGIRSLYECPEYIALSYHWGDHKSTRPILLDGRTIQVTTSLEAALQELVARGVTTVWVDALCIDQGNDYEKVFQLRQMGTIFSKAKKVIAWLGPAAEDSDNAMQALKTMHESDGADRHDAAIAQFLKRQYWDRVWIIQELAKASRAEVWCGMRMLIWNNFFIRAQKWLSTSELWASDIDHSILTLKYFCDEERKSRMGAARILLSTAMVRTLHTRATLKRDRVYALLGISRDGAETVPTPNYVQSDEQVFNPILKHMIVKQGQLDLMFLAGLARKNGSSPSWLPTWNSKMPLQANPWLVECFRLPPDRNDVVTCRDDILQVNGQILGQVQIGTELTLRSAVSSLAEMLLEIASKRFRRGTPFSLSYDLWPPLEPHARELNDIIFSAEGRQRAKNLEQRKHDPKLKKFWGIEKAYKQNKLWYITLLQHRVRELPKQGRLVPSTPNIHRLRRASEVSLQDRFLDDSPKTLRRTSSVSSQSRIRDHFPKFPLWISRLEVTVANMLRHGVKLHRLEQDEFVILPQIAKESDFVADIANCSLPVVIRRSGDDRYSVVGEVVGRYTWEKADEMRLPRYIKRRVLHLI
jgi:hypothetical protein